MGKFTIIVFVVYALYYAVIVAYDLFLKKDVLANEVTIEEHTLDHIKTVNIPERQMVSYISENVDKANTLITEI